MSDRLLLSVLLPLFVALAGAPAAAFEDRVLAAAAGRYADELRQRYSGVPAAEIRLRDAEAHIDARRYRRAVGEYEKAVGRRPDAAALWFWLSRAWSADARLDPRTWSGPGAADASADGAALDLERAAQAAYAGWRRAARTADKAYALRRLGAIYERQQRPLEAIEAYRASVALGADPALAGHLQALLEAHAFRVIDVAVTSDSAEPELCLTFSEALLERGVDYRDYLRLDPDPGNALSLSARGNKLCARGLQHGRSYRVELRPGLPGDGDSQLAAADAFDAAVADRAASLGFRGSAYVLPKGGRGGVPLVSVNVDAVALRLLRINDRNLVEQLNQRRLSSTLSGYDIDAIAERSGEQVWSGVVELDAARNQELTTALPSETLLPDPQPGIYALVAENAAAEPNRYQRRATQWLLVSDIGLYTLNGDDGLHVFARSLAGADALAAVTLKLYARNNEELGSAVSDADGYARFAPGLLRGDGGRRAAALMAYRDDDFAFLDLGAPAFDLSDRGVAGRAAPGPVDAYLYTDRGVYRPGESVELMTLLRDADGRALTELPVTLSVVRPDQVEVSRVLARDGAAGGHHARLALPDNARSGRWRVRAYLDPDAAADGSTEPVGEVDFRVEDFVPQQLKLTLDSTTEVLGSGASAAVTLRGRFLYGAPAAGLDTDAELILREDPEPYPDYPGYRFGLAQDSWTARRFDLDPAVTDADGRAALSVTVSDAADTSRPLAAVLRATLFEPGGRPVNRSLVFKYRPRPFEIGVRPRFDDALAEGGEAVFDLIAVGADGARVAAAGLRYELVREEYDYYWYYQNSRWQYKLIVDDGERVAGGGIAVAAGDAATLRQTALRWGAYRLDVYDPDSGAASGVRFRVGWWVEPGGADTPDRLQLTLDRDVYRPGDTAKVYIKGAFAGTALVNVVDARLRRSFSVALDADGSTVELPVDDWGAGVYVTVSAFRPAGPEQGPRRALGLAWLALDDQLRRLDVALDAPDALRPRQRVTLPLTVAGAEPDAPVYATLAAVDEGILQLTDFADPDPLGHYFGKRRLGMQLRDLYGRLIEADGRPGRLRGGGDEAGRNLAGSGVRTVRTVALFSGPLALGEDGRAEVELELPDFNGELRLMAVAWSPDRVGSASRPLTVRDPLVVNAYLPRFLAQDDRASVRLTGQAFDAPPGGYTLRVETAGAVAATVAGRGGNGGDVLRFRLGDGASATTAFDDALTLHARGTGTGTLALTVDGPDGFSLRRDWNIGVRPYQALAARRDSRRLAPGETLTLGAELLTAYRPEQARLRLNVSSRPNWNVPGLLDALERYPYGCVEQTTSRALPLLYVDELTQNWYGDDAAPASAAAAVPRGRIQGAVRRLLTMQNYAGGFGLWRGDSPTELWLSAYALDFLGRAARAGFLVPDSALDRGYDWLQRGVNRADYEPRGLPGHAYALYLLSGAGRVGGGELRYLYDNYLDALPTPLARAQLGAALAAYGDRERAAGAFRAALDGDRDAHGARSTRWYYRDYGSGLRDAAGVLALASAAGFAAGSELDARLSALAETVAREHLQRRYTSTQEQSWLLLAARALLAERGRPELRVDGVEVLADPLRLTTTAARLADAPLVLANGGASPVWVSTEASGVPVAELAAESRGLRISRRWYRRDGTRFDGGGVAQNDVFVVVISGGSDSGLHHQALVVDLLPAGFEIDNLRLAHNATLDEFAWLPTLSETRHVDPRDDRFVAALDLDPEDPQFRVAYLLRAVTPGEYRVPAPFVEDMYQPDFFARGGLGSVRIVARR